MGAGATQRLSAVRWGLAGNIVFAWILTIPAAALVAAAVYWPIQAHLLTDRPQGLSLGPVRTCRDALALDLLERLFAALSTFGGTCWKRSGGPYFFAPLVMPQKTNLRSAAALSVFSGRITYVNVLIG